jgi:hypothetical protein
VLNSINFHTLLFSGLLFWLQHYVKEHRFNYVDAKFGLDSNVYICDSFHTSCASQELPELSILHPHKLGNECIK